MPVALLAGSYIDLLIAIDIEPQADICTILKIKRILPKLKSFMFIYNILIQIRELHPERI